MAKRYRVSRAPLPTEGVERPVIDEALAKLLEHHKGRWVAVDGSTIVAVGDSASEVIKGALEAGVTDPLVFKVATHPERLNFL